MKINFKILLIGIAISILLTYLLPNHMMFLFLPFIGGVSFIGGDKKKKDDDDDEDGWHL